MAEDHPVNRQVMLGLLAHLGYRADFAANGLEALDALQRRPYDLVLMDIQMPEMDGLEATRRIRRLGPGGSQPRIVAMTAHAMAGDRERCLAGGMDGYLSKPVQIADLAAALAGTEAGPIRQGPAPQPAEPLNLQALELLRQLSTDGKDILGELVRTFAASSSGDLAELRRLTAEGLWLDVEKIAHRLKGSSGCLGAVRVETLCAIVQSGCARRGRTRSARWWRSWGTSSNARWRRSTGRSGAPPSSQGSRPTPDRIRTSL